jgi:hypothetical protein
MRLLDRVAHCRSPFRLALGHHPSPFQVTGPSCYAARVADCPLRFVLCDDLTRVCTELAFADGARLAGCLDLLRVPARNLWIEWNDEVHKRVIYETQWAADYDSASIGRRVGALLEGSPDGYRAVMRIFWADSANDETEVTLSPLETHIDLRGGLSATSDIRIDQPDDPAMSCLLGHMRFRFDDAWAAYYQAAATNSRTQHEVVHASLSAVARDPPLILAFLLLLSAKDATRSIPVSRAVINRKREIHGHPPLLDHIEVRASLNAVQETDSGGFEAAGRQSPRLHHVRGHLVRRDNRVFWRVPHLRGSAARGILRSRTVCLSFAQPRALERTETERV